MRQYQLNNSGVVFYQETHEYFLGQKELKGITKLISKHLFPDKYKGIPDYIIDNAAKRGSEIHRLMRVFDIFGIEDNEIAIKYKELKDTENITTIDNEYIVTDYKNFASQIDIVSLVKNELSLIDIKSTYKLDKEYLRWQLSIYKHLFELVNPLLEVKKLYGLHAKDNFKLVEIEPIEKEVIKTLLESEIKCETFINPFIPKISENEQEKAILIIDAIMDIATKIKNLEEKKEEYNNLIETIFNELKVDKWDTDFFTITKKSDYERTSFDSKKLQSENEEIYKKYLKTITVKGGIITKLK